MNPIKHSACNDTLGAGDNENCVDLPIMRHIGDGSFGVKDVPYVTSFWKPEPEELELLKQGHPVMLCVAGVTHAPLFVTVPTIKE